MGAFALASPAVRQSARPSLGLSGLSRLGLTLRTTDKMRANPGEGPSEPAFGV